MPSALKVSRTSLVSKQVGRAEWQLYGLVALAVFVGGGGAGAAAKNMVVQTAGLTLLAINKPLVIKFLKEAPLFFRALILASVALPVLQLVPLPPVVWQGLPGRDLIVQSFAIVGIEGRWWPISVYPLRTAIAVSGLIAPLCVVILAHSVSGRAIERTLKMLILLGWANVSLGVIQLATANHVGYLFSERASPERMYGFFANHNTTGIFFVAISCCSIGISKFHTNGIERIFYRNLSFAVFVLAVIMTQSRSSISIMILVLLYVIFVEIKASGSHSLRGRPRIFGTRILAASGATILAVAAIGLIATSDRGVAVIERYNGLSKDPRFKIWQDSIASAKRFMPVGAGVGAFDTVFQLDESLENLAPGRAGRAHNELLEVAIEAGVVGLLMLAAWLSWLLLMVRRNLFKAQPPSSAAATVALICIGLQSLVDYPLRSQAGLCLAATFAVIAMCPNCSGRSTARHKESGIS